MTVTQMAVTQMAVGSIGSGDSDGTTCDDSFVRSPL